MASLWRNTDYSAWQAAREGYWDVVQGLGSQPLLELDRWFQEELPTTLAARKDDPHITKDELIKLVEWKMTRNAWRPNHRMLRDSEPAAKVVEQKSRAALALIRRGDGSGGSSSGAEPGEAAIRQALNALATAKPIAKLKGVGPATASAVLQAADPSVPFLSEEAMEAALGEKDYTVGKVIQLTNALRSKAAALTAKALSKPSGRAWTAKDVENALFAAACGSGGASSGGEGSGKAASGKAAKRQRV